VVCSFAKKNVKKIISFLTEPPSSPRPPGSRGLSELQKRNLTVTPPRVPANSLAFETMGKETETADSEYDNPGSSADRSSISLIRVSDVSQGEGIGQNVDESMDQETSPSIIPLSQTQDSGFKYRREFAKHHSIFSRVRI